MGQIVGGGSSGEDDDGDAAAAAEQDRCLKWTRQSADNYMFRYSFDPETFSFVEVDEKGDACPTRPPTRSKAPLRFGDCFSGAGGLSLGLQAAGLQQEFAVESCLDSQNTFRGSHAASAKLFRESVEAFLENVGLYRNFLAVFSQDGSDVVVGRSKQKKKITHVGEVMIISLCCAVGVACLTLVVVGKALMCWQVDHRASLTLLPTGTQTIGATTGRN